MVLSTASRLVAWTMTYTASQRRSAVGASATSKASTAPKPVICAAVPLEYSIGRLICAFASSQGTVMPTVPGIARLVVRLAKENPLYVELGIM